MTLPVGRRTPGGLPFARQAPCIYAMPKPARSSRCFACPSQRRLPSIFFRRGKDTLVTDCKYAPPKIWTRGTVPVHGFPEDAFRSFSHQVISAFGQVGASQLFASQGSRFLLYDCVNGQTRELAALKEKGAGRHWDPVVSPDGSMMIVRVMTWHSHWVNGSLARDGEQDAHWEIWRVPWKTPVPMTLPAGVCAKAILPDNEHVLGEFSQGDYESGGTLGIRLWKIGDYDHAVSLYERPFAKHSVLIILDLAVSADGKYAAFNFHNPVETVLLDLAAKATRRTWSEASNLVPDLRGPLSFSADGRRLCDGYLRCVLRDMLKRASRRCRSTTDRR